MTVKELIKQLEAIEDKELIVTRPYTGSEVDTVENVTISESEYFYYEDGFKQMKCVVVD